MSLFHSHEVLEFMLEDVDEGSQLILDPTVLSPTLWNFRGSFSFHNTRPTPEFEACIDELFENYLCRTTSEAMSGFENPGTVPAKLADEYRYGLCLKEFENHRRGYLNKKHTSLGAATIYANLFEQPTSLLTFKTNLIFCVQSTITSLRNEGYVRLPPRIIAPNPYLIERTPQDSYSRVVPATALEY